MVIGLHTIDAISTSLGYGDIEKYYPDPQAIDGLKHLIWILRNDGPDHEFRRYIGEKRLVQTDLLPFLLHSFHEPDVADVVLRLLVNLTFPTDLIYKENHPKNASDRKKMLQLMEIAEGYKEAFTVNAVWSVLGEKMQSILRIKTLERSEAQAITVERILMLARNILQVPANVEKEKQLDNEDSLHDRLVWALDQTCTINIVSYILGSSSEQQYFMHALEIIYLVFREQQPANLVNATMQRIASEKREDEVKLLEALQQPKTAKLPLPPRHSRFRGTYLSGSVKSISDNPTIAHQSLSKIIHADLGIEKERAKKSSRLTRTVDEVERKSILSVRMCLRQYCVEILNLFNNIVRQAKRYLGSADQLSSDFHDDTYLLWAIRFFMAFNRMNGMNIELIGEALSMNTFHWIISRIESYQSSITCDKTRKNIWSKRLHNAVQTYDEMLYNLRALSLKEDHESKELLLMLQNNIFYAVEYRETIVQLLTNYNESYQTRNFLRSVVEVANRFYSLLEKFCDGTVRVQTRVKSKRKKQKGRKGGKSDRPPITPESLEYDWLSMAPKIAAILPQIHATEENLPTPFDVTSSVPFDDQKGDCMIRIHRLLRDEKYEDALKLMYAARSVWTNEDCFGSTHATEDEDLMCLKEIFMANIAEEQETPLSDEDEEDDDEEDEAEEYEARTKYAEKDFKFEDFSKRLVDPKIVRNCVTVLSDWETIKTPTMKAAIHILHRIAVQHKTPAMLFQASLFRIFQRALHAKPSEHTVPLQQLALYVIRQLQKKAPDNEVIFAELLFYKSAKICYGLEEGYGEVFNRPAGAAGSGSKNWSEEQEEELRRLFMENQENPQTDQDVIDWLLDNMIDRTRTRRAVIKKLKELGLIFKAPTKKSNANQKQMDSWDGEQIERLTQLYEEHRFERNVVKKIRDAFGQTFSRQAIVKQMVRIGLIADESEVKARRPAASKSKGRRRKERRDSGSSSASHDSEEEEDDAANDDGPAVVLDQKVAEKMMKLMGSSMTPCIDWVSSSMEFVCNSGTIRELLRGGRTIYPKEEHQILALKDGRFRQFLLALGMEATNASWCIPEEFEAANLKQRIELLQKLCNSREASPVAADRSIEEEDVADQSNTTHQSVGVAPAEDSDEDEMPSFSKRKRSPGVAGKRDRSDSSDSMESSTYANKKSRKRMVVSSDDED
ncbi:protein timeless homolog [Anopheles aquasalis]|uniref:protein timeless homolog n=1 Tax=Anopheles aquasalis TaxID=42839 RepID=UPI00215B3D6E|nr:protein timeless homolog [Anopheles aquasalis]